jgi:hypothetical protein
VSSTPFDAMTSHRARTTLARVTAQLLHWLGPQTTIELLVNQAEQIELLYNVTRPAEAE